LQNRTTYERGCNSGCFLNSITEKPRIADCTNGCVNAKCRRLCGDANGDCSSNIFDLAAIGLAFNNPAGVRTEYDLTGDGKVNIFDLASAGKNYGKNCSQPDNTTVTARGQIMSSLANGENFSSFPARWEVYREGAFIGGAGIINRAPDGLPHNFVINIVPGDVSVGIYNAFGISSCGSGLSCNITLGNRSFSLRDYMSSFVNRPREPFLAYWNQSVINSFSIAYPMSAPAGTYIFLLVACKIDNTTITSAEGCTAQNRNWGTSVVLENLVRDQGC
jgi:hypothetical protein